MLPYRLWPAMAVALFVGVGPAVGQENCNTALTRLARGAAEKAIRENGNDACSGLKHGPLAIDKTKALELREFRLCEEGPIVRASVAVYIKCATSDAAFVRTSLDETMSAIATANLDTCKVTDARVSAAGDLARAGLIGAGAANKMRDEIEKAIKPYCKQ